MLPYKEMPKFETNTERFVFLSSGKLDQMVHVSEIENYKTILEKGGYKVKLHKLDVGHNLTLEDIKLAVEWVKKNFK